MLTRITVVIWRNLVTTSLHLILVTAADGLARSQARGQGISSHGIDLVFPEHSHLSNRIFYLVRKRISGIILGMGSANERRRYYITPLLIDQVHSQNDLWYICVFSSEEGNYCCNEWLVGLAHKPFDNIDWSKKSGVSTRVFCLKTKLSTPSSHRSWELCA